MSPLVKVYFRPVKWTLTAPLLLFFWITGLRTTAQVNVQFCVQVNDSGNCVKPSSEFYISKEGGTISMLLKSETNFTFTKVRYKLYTLNEDGTETHDYTVEQRISTDWDYAWQDVIFYEPGQYKVKVFLPNDEETFLCSAILKIYRAR